MIDRPRASWPGRWARSSASATTCSTPSAASYERWDGKGFPGELAGDAHPGGVADRAAGRVPRGGAPHRRRRRGPRRWRGAAPASSSTPPSSRSSCADAEKVFHGLDELGLLGRGDRRRAGPGRSLLSQAECDEALAAIGRFVDLKSPYTLGHSAAVADLAAAHGRRPRPADGRTSGSCAGPGWCRLRPARGVQRDLGQGRPAHRRRVGAGPAVPARTPSGCCTGPRRWRPLDGSPGSSRERLDGSGYPGGLGGRRLSLPSRILATADAVPDDARGPAAPAGALGRGRGGDASCGTTCAPAGSTAPSSTPCSRRPASGSSVAAAGPAGLTAREVEVLHCLARGLSNQRDRASAGDQPEDRRQPRRARLHQDRRHQPRGGQPVRDAPRAGPGELAASRTTRPAARSGHRRSGRWPVRR